VGTQPKGEYGRGELYEKHGSWYGRWRTPTGAKRNRKVGPVKRTGVPGLNKTEARRELARLIEQDGSNAPSHQPDEVPTVVELAEALAQRLATQGRSTSHVENTRSIARTKFAPFFRKARVDQITDADLDRFMAWCARGGGSRTGRRASPKSIRLYMSTLHSTFELAIRKKYIQLNPCRLVDLPVIPDRKDIRFLTLDELEAVIRAAEDDELGYMEAVLWRTCAMVGLRMSETRGFRWQDIDWFARRVRIRKVNVRGEIKDPKSRRGSRSVPLPTVLAQELERHAQRCAATGDDDLVFAHPLTGNPYDGSKALKRYKAACRRAGVTKTNRLHDLRHTFGTQMAARDVPMRTLQEWMGHRDFATTLIYADYAPSAHEADMIDAAWAPAAPLVPRAGTAGTTVCGARAAGTRR
jgi:integrase